MQPPELWEKMTRNAAYAGRNCNGMFEMSFCAEMLERKRRPASTHRLSSSCLFELLPKSVLDFLLTACREGKSTQMDAFKERFGESDDNEKSD